MFVVVSLVDIQRSARSEYSGDLFWPAALPCVNVVRCISVLYDEACGDATCHAAGVCCMACTVMVEAMHSSSIAARCPT